MNYPAINASDLADIPVFVHPLPQQCAIADYLDRETARLDALVAAKQRLLAPLVEKRRAIITPAVTRGLDPRAPMRYSGVPWLGQIPEHWKVERARWLFRERDQRSEDGSEELLTVSHLNRRRFGDWTQETGRPAKGGDLYDRIAQGAACGSDRCGRDGPNRRNWKSPW